MFLTLYTQNGMFIEGRKTQSKLTKTPNFILCSKQLPHNKISTIWVVLELVAMQHNNEAMMHSNRSKGFF